MWLSLVSVRAAEYVDWLPTYVFQTIVICSAFLATLPQICSIIKLDFGVFIF